ncbi:hypothetical protein MRX96_033080 [Rhipicephalus microplus]
MEDDAASNYPADCTADDDAGGCWKTIIRKRRARRMNSHKKTQPSENIPGISPRNVRSRVVTSIGLDFLYTIKISFYALIEGFAWIAGHALNSPALSGVLLV